MYEKKFDGNDVRPEGFEAGAVYTVTKPVECRDGVFKEGSKVVLEVWNLCNVAGNEITFKIIGSDGEKPVCDLFSVKIQPESVDWLSEHFEKDEVLSNQLSAANKIMVDKNFEASTKESKITAIASYFMCGSCLLSMIFFILAILFLFSKIVVLVFTILFGVVFLAGAFTILACGSFYQNKSFKAESDYERCRQSVLNTANS